MLVCVDTMMLIWGVQGTARPNQQGMIPRARAYLKELAEKRHHILVPTPVITEYLTPFDANDRTAQLEVLQKMFVVAPFDLRASVIAAELWGQRDRLKAIREEYGSSRGKVKMDCHIVAVAKAHGASHLVSHDEGLRKIAEGYVTAIDVPERDKQMDFL